MLSTLREGPGLSNKTFYVLMSLLMLFAITVAVYEMKRLDTYTLECHAGYLYEVNKKTGKKTIRKAHSESLQRCTTINGVTYYV